MKRICNISQKKLILLVSFYESSFYLIDVFLIESLSHSCRKKRLQYSALSNENFDWNNLMTNRDSSVDRFESSVSKSSKNLKQLKRNFREIESKTYRYGRQLLSRTASTRDVDDTTTRHEHTTTLNAIEELFVVFIHRFFVFVVIRLDHSERFVDFSFHYDSTTIRSSWDSRRKRSDVDANKDRSTSSRKNRITNKKSIANRRIARSSITFVKHYFLFKFSSASLLSIEYII
jgi:hypothetical protein